MAWIAAETSDGNEVTDILNKNKSGPGPIVVLNSRSTWNIWCDKDSAKDSQKSWSSKGEFSDGNDLARLIDGHRGGEVIVAQNSRKSWNAWTFG